MHSVQLSHKLWGSFRSMFIFFFLSRMDGYMDGCTLWSRGLNRIYHICTWAYICVCIVHIAHIHCRFSFQCASTSPCMYVVKFAQGEEGSMTTPGRQVVLRNWNLPRLCLFLGPTHPPDISVDSKSEIHPPCLFSGSAPFTTKLIHKGSLPLSLFQKPTKLWVH